LNQESGDLAYSLMNLELEKDVNQCRNY